MALWFPLRVNSRTIAYVDIARRDDPIDDGCYTYDWAINTNVGKLTKSESGIQSGEVVHRYNDGAFRLIQKVLADYLGEQ